MKDHRTFIAMPLPEEIYQVLGKIKRELNEIDTGIRWVAPEQMHITLKFLGETPERMFPQIREEIIDITKNTPKMSFELANVGRFPIEGYPKTIWAGLGANTPKAVHALSYAFNSTFISYGFDDSGKRFSPHITLGRVKGKIEEDFLAQFHEVIIPALKFEIDQIIWYESIRHHGILRYEPIEIIKL